MGGKHYTIVVMPDTNDKIKLQVLNDYLVPPPADKAEVRVIQASPDAGEVDVVVKQGNKRLWSECWKRHFLHRRGSYDKHTRGSS